LLRATLALLAQAGWQIGNVDATIITEQPKMAPDLPQMAAHIAAYLQVPASCGKAKTVERLGFVSRGEGIATEAVVLICQEAASSQDRCRKFLQCCAMVLQSKPNFFL
jgi:2-C-methyl-D-erythritol 2,4-cyclodiphosphate synthase